MLKKISLAIVTSLLLFSANAFAGGYVPEVTPPPAPAGNWYWDFFGGIVFTPGLTTSSSIPCGGALGTKLRYDSAGFDVGTGVGYVTGPFRWEGQYTFMRTGHDELNNLSNDGRTTVHAGMFNVYYDFQNISDAFSPFMGAGIGWSQIRTSSLGTCATNQNEFAYQAMAGGLFHVDNEFDVSLYYRYFATNKPSNLFTKRFQNHVVNLGVMYHIPE